MMLAVFSHHDDETPIGSYLWSWGGGLIFTLAKTQWLKELVGSGINKNIECSSGATVRGRQNLQGEPLVTCVHHLRTSSKEHINLSKASLAGDQLFNHPGLWATSHNSNPHTGGAF